MTWEKNYYIRTYKWVLYDNKDYDHAIKINIAIIYIPIIYYAAC